MGLPGPFRVGEANTTSARTASCKGIGVAPRGLAWGGAEVTPLGSVGHTRHGLGHLVPLLRDGWQGTAWLAVVEEEYPREGRRGLCSL